MKINMRKLFTIIKFKFKMMNNKNTLIAPIMAIGMTLIMRILYTSLLDGEDMPDFMFALVLNMGLSFSVCMTGMTVTSSSLAEEKEKHTLRTLMTSSVNGLEFFLGSIIPPLILIMAINIVVLLISGMSLELISIPMYLLVTFIASVTSCIIGMLVGIFAKDQMTSGTLATPVMMVFLMIPIFSGFNESLGKVSEFLFTGVVTQMIDTYAAGQAFKLSAMNAGVLLGEIIIAVGLFVFFYRKNGYEAD